MPCVSFGLASAVTKKCARHVMHHILMNARRVAWTRGGVTWTRGLWYTFAFQQARARTHTHAHTHTQKRKHTHTWKITSVDSALLVFSLFGNSNSKIFVMKQALRLCRTGCGRCVSTARSIFVKKKKKQLAHLKEDAVRLRAERNRLHTEVIRLRSKRNRLRSKRNDLRAELANLQQQQKDPTERLRKRFKTVVSRRPCICQMS